MPEAPVRTVSRMVPRSSALMNASSFVPAPVSRYFILDLLPGRSFAGHVGDAGFDVYIADFGTPTREDRFADLTYYVEGLVRRCVRTVLALTDAPQINLVGYCLGGTLALLYTALYPETVRRLMLLTTTVDGDVQGGIPWIAHRLGLAGESYDSPRLVPAAEVKSWFEMLAPGSNSLVGRVNDLWDRLDAWRECGVTTLILQAKQPEATPAIIEKQRALTRRLLGPARDEALEARMADLAVPVLVVFGTLDSVVPPEMGRHYKELLPNCSLVFLYDAAHEADADRPEAFVSLVNDFLERHEAFVVSTKSSLINR